MKFTNRFVNYETNSGNPLWFAIMMDGEDDTDWGYGSSSFQESAEKVVDLGAGAYIAVIDGCECIAQMTCADLIDDAINEAKELREMTGLKRAEFCRKYSIPVRTMENWESNTSSAPAYVINLLERAIREDYNLPRIYRVYTAKGDEEWEMLKTADKLEAIATARLERKNCTHAYKVEVRLYAEDIDDEDCTNFDYDLVEF